MIGAEKVTGRVISVPLDSKNARGPWAGPASRSRRGRKKGCQAQEGTLGCCCWPAPDCEVMGRPP